MANPRGEAAPGEMDRESAGAWIDIPCPLLYTEAGNFYLSHNRPECGPHHTIPWAEQTGVKPGAGAGLFTPGQRRHSRGGPGHSQDTAV